MKRTTSFTVAIYPPLSDAINARLATDPGDIASKADFCRRLIAASLGVTLPPPPKAFSKRTSDGMRIKAETLLEEAITSLDLFDKNPIDKPHP